MDIQYFLERILFAPVDFVLNHPKITVFLLFSLLAFFLREELLAVFSYVETLYKGSSNGDKLVFLGVLITVASTILCGFFFSRR